MPAPDQKTDAGDRMVANNRRALRDYNVLDRFEAGIELRGAEVKSIRDGHVSIAESFARIENGELVVQGLHILPYRHSRVDELDPVRPRKLLMHRREIDRIAGHMTLKGHALIPLKIYFKRGRVKVELGLCRGKQMEDKRETLKRKTAEREAERAIASRTRGR